MGAGAGVSTQVRNFYIASWPYPCSLAGQTLSPDLSSFGFPLVSRAIRIFPYAQFRARAQKILKIFPSPPPFSGARAPKRGEGKEKYVWCKHDTFPLALPECWQYQSNSRDHMTFLMTQLLHGNVLRRINVRTFTATAHARRYAQT